ncbi:MAG TPA: tyrosine-type recombinase/integrase, partial [Frankiaceae bacterium]|nr:tyrosine-type recombinase/integrase [Frankiaceae bacterium]
MSVAELGRPGGHEPLDPAQVCRRYLEHLTVERGLARNSLLAYERDLRRYRAHLAGRGVRSLGEVGEAEVAGFLATLRAGDEHHPPLSPASTARVLVSVRGLHRFAQREGDLPVDVSRPVRPPTPPRRLPRALSVEQVEALLAAAGPSAVGDAALAARGLRARALLELLYGTGARISEAVGVDVDDLDLAEGAVRLRGKGGRARVVPLGRCAREALSAYLVRGRPVLAGARSGGAVFLSARGNRMSRQS